MAIDTLPKTWQEALENHPITSARTFEKQLRASALRDKEKLRTLVGSNYRDLLSTAEQIVELSDQTRKAEVSISALSQACKPPSEINTSTPPSQTAIQAGHVKLTDRFLRSASKATKDKHVLLASRLIVIARLLLKHLEQTYNTSKTTQWLTTRLKNCRQQLLHCIDTLFVRPGIPLNQLIQATAAYCLCTSSSSADAIRHFRTLRAQRLAQGSSTETLSRSQLRNDVRQRCHYFVISVSAIKALSGRGVVELLNGLQKQPILEDREVLAIETLQLDSVRGLLPPDILSFTPYFKRTTSTASELRSSLQAWVNEVSKYLLRHIESVIENGTLKDVIKTRQAILDVLLPSCSSTQTYEIINTSIRETFSERIIQLVRDRARELSTLGTEIIIVVESSQASTETIWQSDLSRKMTAQPPPPPSCLRDLRRSHLGITENLLTYFDRLRKYLLECRRTRDQIERMGKIRWQDKIEDFDEDDEDEEEEEEAISRDLGSSLSKKDPASYLTAFNEAAHESADRFISDIDKIASQQAELFKSGTNESGNGVKESTNAPLAAQLVTLLRITREAIQVLTSLLPTKDLQILQHTVTNLHKALAQHVANTLFQQLDSSHPQHRSASPTAIASHFIPSDLPSPTTIHLLKTLCTLLSTTGALDIWTIYAIQQMKQAVLDMLMRTEHKEKFVRSELDEAYLSVALGSGGGGSGQTTTSNSEKETSDGKTTTMTATATQERQDVEKRAVAYWNRTRLLFGVLSP